MSGLDDVVDDILSKVLTRRPFVNLWQQRVEQDLANAQEYDDPPPTEPTPPADVRRDRLCEVMGELVRTVEAATQTFLSTVDTTFRHNEPEPNRDASSHFTVKVQIDRLKLANTPERVESCARRLLQITRVFPVRIASTIQLSNTLWFATSLCDMLFSLEEFLVVLPKYEDEWSSLRRCASHFNEMVVARLLQLLRASESKRLRAERSPSTRTFFTPQPEKKRRPLIQMQHRSPGFLMSPDLVKDRQRIMRTRSSTPQLPRGRSTPGSRPNTSSGTARVVADAMEQKWGKLLAAEKTMRDSVGNKDDQQTRWAREISANVVKELRKELGKGAMVIID